MRVLVTGATGFVGRTLVPMLQGGGFDVVAAVRMEASLPCRTLVVGSIEGSTDWRAALADVDAIVHLAARAHQLRDSHPNPEQAFEQTNAGGTKSLATQAGGRRFVYLSTIGVHGASTSERPITEDTPIQPHDAYSRSKLQAEEAIRGSGAPYTILRPPLVYGRGAPGNLEWLCRSIASGKPLPLANASGLRSMISVRNLGDLILTVLKSEAAVGKTYVVAEEKPFRTSELARSLADGMGVRPRFYSLPVSLVKAGAAALGRGRIADRLYGHLLVDASSVRQELGWTPPHKPEEDLLAMAAEYRRA